MGWNSRLNTYVRKEINNSLRIKNDVFPDLD